MLILDNQALSWLRRNIEENLYYYQYYKETWLDKFIEGVNINTLEQDETLVISNNPSLDTINAINFYEQYKTLSTSIASNENFWTTLAHIKYYNYIHTRWNINRDTKARNIEERFFFNSDSQKSRARHGLTRLWWIAHITYDEKNKEDPYYYTKLATKDQELYNLIIETKYIARNKKALFAMLDVFVTAFNIIREEKINNFNKRNFFRETMQHINLIGSVTIWDMLSKEESKQKLMNFVSQYLEEKKTRNFHLIR